MTVMPPQKRFQAGDPSCYQIHLVMKQELVAFQGMTKIRHRTMNLRCDD